MPAFDCPWAMSSSTLRSRGASAWRGLSAVWSPAVDDELGVEAKAADDQRAAYTDVPADQKHQAVEPVAVCTSGSLTSGSKDDAEAPKATGRVGAVSRAGPG